jgi:chemotaxis signal transduction protein
VRAHLQAHREAARRRRRIADRVLHAERPAELGALARRLGVEHAQPLVERKLVVVERDDARLAVCVDDVRDPEELPRDRVLAPGALPGSRHGVLRNALVAVAQTPRGAVPVIDPRALASPKLLREVAAALRAEVPA